MSLTLTLERGGGEVSGSGTNIELDGTIAGGAIESVEMYGDTEQAASPTPDSPQTVQTVTGRQLVTISDGGSESQEYEINLGKNLCDGINQEYWLTSTATGAGVSSGNSGLIIPIEQNTSYTISTTSSQSRYRVAFSDQTYQGIQFNCYNGANRDGTSDVITRNSENHKYLIVNATDLTKIQIEKGSTASSFAPYFTPIELCKIGTYQDYIYKSGEDWYVHKDLAKVVLDGSDTSNYGTLGNGTGGIKRFRYSRSDIGNVPDDIRTTYCDIYQGIQRRYTLDIQNSISQYTQQNMLNITTSSTTYTLNDYLSFLSSNPATVYYVLATPTDTQITNATLIAQLEALNAATTYDGTTVITVSSENLAGSLEVTVSTNIAKTYTEVEIGSPFTITDVEGKSSNTTLDGNVYVDWAYNKKQYSFDLFNLTPQDYADIRAYYDYQFSNSAFPTITVPELNIDRLPVYMEISSRNIINQCLLTDKLTIKFRETVQP